MVLSNALNMVVISIINPDLIKLFLAPDKVPTYPKLRLLIDGLKSLFGLGISFSEGAIWKAKRKILSKVFNFDLLKENVTKISQICDRTFQKLENDHSSANKQYEYYALDIGLTIFTGVMMRCFFGCDEINERVDGLTFQQFTIQLFQRANKVRLSRVVLIFGDKAFKFGMTKAIRDLKRRISIFKAIAQDLVKKRQQQVKKSPKNGKSTDMIEALIRQRETNKDNSEAEYEYTIDDIVEQFSTFLIAGTDTTAHLLMMMVYYLCDYPEIEKIVRKKVEEVIKDDADITFENLRKLEYIEWLQNQTTRFYGPGNAIFVRQAQTDNFIGDIPIRKGMGVNINTMANHYDPKYYKDPHAFRPERWESECDNLHPFAFMGFSGGLRGCIGKHLAYLESKIALVKLMKRYSKFEIPKEKRTMVHNFVYEPLPFNTRFFKK